MLVETSHDYKDVRRAYELGRLRASAWKALLVALPVAALGVATSGRSALFALPVTLAAWIFALWRGDVFLRGAFYGLAGGLVTSVLPLSILRPCCAAGAPMGKDCCTMPGACLVAGALVGIFLAAVVPFGQASWRKTAAGLALGMTSVAAVKCTTLFAGEATGLIAGLIAGLAASTLARRAMGHGSAA